MGKKSRKTPERKEAFSEEDEEIKLSFEPLINFFKNLTKSDKESKDSVKIKKEADNEEIDLDISSTINFIKKKREIMIPAVLIIIAIFFATWFRMYPAYLPITDQWAEQSVNNYYKSQIKAEINKQYPNLPDANKNQLVEEQFQQFLKSNEAQIAGNIDANSKQLKQQFQYTAENGKEYTYLLAIDPYLWYGFGKNYIECRHTGCDLREDGKFYNYRNGREGYNQRMSYMSLFGVYLHKIISVFNNQPFMYTFFLIPAIFIGLSIIPAFFIAKKVGGNIAGFFAGMFIALNSALLGRTPAGFSDTDSSNIVFPLFIIWMFLEAYNAKDFKKAGIFSGLGAIIVFIYLKIWRIDYLFLILIASLCIFIGKHLLFGLMIKKEKVNNIFKNLKFPLQKAGIFIGATLISMYLSNGISSIINLISPIIEFIFLKDVGITSLWPNVLTTVAEFNVVPLKSIIGQMGGNIFFALALLGITLSAIKKDEDGKRNLMYASILIIWFIATIYSFTKGVRFALLLVPPFSIAFGAGIGILYEVSRDWLSKEFEMNKKVVTTILIIIALFFLGISPNPVSATSLPFCTHGLCKAAHDTALREIPSYNDAWDTALNNIKANASDGVGYITTWWDFGHWFVAHDIRVTFDGGDQGERIHWVGKSLLENDEDKSVGIIRMLNCGQEKAPHVLEREFDGDTVKAIDVLNEIIRYDKQKAVQILKKEGLSPQDTDDVLKTTHCEDLLPQYFITSQDMVGKSGVWAHFGSWNFRRAKMYNLVNKKNQEDGIKILTDDFNLTQAEAQKTYYEIKSTKGDQWIAPWPSYISGISGCSKNKEILRCSNGLNVNITNYDAWVQTQQGILYPKRFAYIDDNGNFKVNEYDKGKVLTSQNGRFLGAVLLKEGDSYSNIMMDDALTASMFTRLFYLNGVGLDNFEKFDDRRDVTGLRIITWKVNFED